MVENKFKLPWDMVTMEPIFRKMENGWIFAEWQALNSCPTEEVGWKAFPFYRWKMSHTEGQLIFDDELLIYIYRLDYTRLG